MRLFTHNKEIMIAYGANRTYAKCIVLQAYDGQARKFQLTRKSKKTARQQQKKFVQDNLFV